MKIKETKAFLRDQLDWVETQDEIYAQMESRLYEMKAIAETCSESFIFDYERRELQERMEKLKAEVIALEKQLHVLVH
ncbi:hypothetical protein [Alteribacter keqinensis]|uniref:Uncharacterized protein n=1 Tax=Alteribacter keqinensis TaxID=2483800 RepID=A0A3M7TQV7_9BACI|nr:hypothetical protein [Alteribacter keqinensis]RNA67559.1 hypothetical protein EBO34_12590 [Alteribacter keqinensis]